LQSGCNFLLCGLEVFEKEGRMIGAYAIRAYAIYGAYAIRAYAIRAYAIRAYAIRPYMRPQEFIAKRAVVFVGDEKNCVHHC